MKGTSYPKEARIILLRLLKDEKPDIAHIHNINGGITFSILPVLREAGVPIVATIHNFKLLCPAYRTYDISSLDVFIEKET